MKEPPYEILFHNTIEHQVEIDLRIEMSNEILLASGLMATLTVISLIIDYFYPPTLSATGWLPRVGCLMVAISVLFASNLIRYKRDESNYGDQLYLFDADHDFIQKAMKYYLDTVRKLSGNKNIVDVKNQSEEKMKMHWFIDLYIDVARSRANAKHYLKLELITAGYGTFLWGFGDLFFAKIACFIVVVFMMMFSFDTYRGIRE